MNKIEEIALRVNRSMDKRDALGNFEDFCVRYAHALLAELSKDAEPYAFEIETENNFGGFDKWVTTDTKHYIDLCNRGEPKPLFTHPAPVIASEQKPECWYDGNTFYANEESASMGCADMANLKPLFTSPSNTADIEQRVAEACAKMVRDTMFRIGQSSPYRKMVAETLEAIRSGKWREYL
jgi:hypothetical protein